MRSTLFKLAKRSLASARRLPAVMVLAVVSVPSIYLIVFIAFTALKTEPEYARDPLGMPTNPTLSNLAHVWEFAGFARYTVNSLQAVGLGVALVTTVSLTAGFALAQLDFPFKRTITVFVLLALVLPAYVQLVPIFLMIHRLGLVNNFFGAALAYSGATGPFSILLMTVYYRTIPREIIQAAQVDGASISQMLRRIGIPLVWPGILVLVLLNVIWYWNELLFSLVILQSEATRTATVGLVSIDHFLHTPVPLVAARAAFSITPAVLVFLFLQRKLAEGITAGAFK